MPLLLLCICDSTSPGPRTFLPVYHPSPSLLETPHQSSWRTFWNTFRSHGHPDHCAMLTRRRNLMRRFLTSQPPPTTPIPHHVSSPPSRDHLPSKPLHLLSPAKETPLHGPSRKIPRLASPRAASGNTNSHPHLLAAPCTHAPIPVWKRTCSRVWILHRPLSS